MKRPLVSLCCSTYSRPDLFAQSLEGLLRQKYDPLEIVILVDGGNPESIALLKACDDQRLRWFATDRPSGMVPAWNKVVSASKGHYFLYCADDDVLCDAAVEEQVALMEANANVGFCHADFFLIDDDNNRIGEWRSHEGTWIKPGLAEWQRYLLQPKSCMQTCVVRRSLWDQVGGWDEDAGYPGDNSLYLKLLRVADVGHVCYYACSYRIRTRSPDSWLLNTKKVREDVALARKHLTNPPLQLQACVEKLDRQVRMHFTVNALTVLADPRGNLEEKKSFAEWIKVEMPPSGAWGLVFRAILVFRLERGVATYRQLEQRARRALRNLVGQLRAAIPLRKP